MKKTIFITLICFIFSLNLNSQNNSGKVIYKIIKNPSSLFSSNSESARIKNFKKELDKKILELKFVLEFNKNSSLFFLQKKLSIDNSEFNTKMAILSTRGDNVFYVDSKKNIVLEEMSFLGKDFLIKSPTSDLKWELTKESKRIGNYLCFKAITERENSGPLKKEDKFSTYIAWYCPEITFNFGPYEVTGLPGLVLEFSNDELIYVASEIKFSNDNIIIKEPKKGKLVTKTEFNNIGKKAFENREFIQD